jgi:hypothetical protein
MVAEKGKEVKTSVRNTGQLKEMDGGIASFRSGVP